MKAESLLPLHCRASRRLNALVVLVLFCAACLPVMAQTKKVSAKTPQRDVLSCARPMGSNYYRLLEYRSNGRLLRPAPAQLKKVRFRSIKLASTNEMARGQRDRALVDPFEKFADGVWLADGSRIYHVESDVAGEGFVRVTPRGLYEILAWTTHPAGFNVEIAVSHFDPFMAVVGNEALPEYGGNHLVLIRTDGRGTLSGALAQGISTPMGADVKPESLCFLRGALFANDEEKLYRLNLKTLALNQVNFPPSAGQTPVYVDSTCAPAASGSAMAIGAGASLLSHDIYTVNAQGLAINQTQWAHKYLPARSADDDGMLMALSPNGERLGYVLDNYYPYAYTMDVEVAGSYELFTGADFFPCYIDTIVGLGFATRETIVFSAGSTLNQLDAYSLRRDMATIPEPGMPAQIAPAVMRNITKTSSTPQLPFLIDSTLTLKRRFTVGPNTYLTHQHVDGTIDFQVVDGDGNNLGLVSEDVVAVLPMDGSTVIVDHDTLDRIRVTARMDQGNPTVISTFTSPKDEIVVSKTMRADGKDACLLLDLNGTQRFVLIDSNGVTGSYSLNGACAERVVRGRGNRLYFLCRRQGFTDLLVFDLQREAWLKKVRIPQDVVAIP